MEARRQRQDVIKVLEGIPGFQVGAYVKQNAYLLMEMEP